jgi:hypothetical protein
LAEWITRSKEAPLDITADLCVDETAFHNEAEKSAGLVEKSVPFLKLIIPQAYRWRNFRFDADYYRIAWVWLTRLATIASAPALVRFSLYCHEVWDDEEGEIFVPAELDKAFTFFPEGSPVLKEVVLWGVHVHWNGVSFLRGLEIFELGWHTKDTRIPHEVFSQTLIQSPALKSLAIEKSGPIPYAWLADTRIPLVHLQNIQLAYIPIEDAVSLLNHIHFPVLVSENVITIASTEKTLIS